MCRYQVLHLRSLADLRLRAEQWDDLWWRCDVTHVTARAALIDAWTVAFAPEGTFQALSVTQGDRMVAALPLVARRKGRFMTCLDVPGNEWASAGQFLLDPDCDATLVCDLIAKSLLELRCAAVWFASIPLDAPAWQALGMALRRTGGGLDSQHRYCVGVLPLEGVVQRLPQGLRRQLQRSRRRLERLGELSLHVHHPGSFQEAQGDLDRGLHLEQAGWKGRAGTSLLAHPQALGYLREQAAQLARWGQLQLAALRLGDQWLAFEYGWVAKHVYHSYKVAYDERYRQYGPGQLLVYLLLEHFTQSRQVHRLDFVGPLDDAVRRWRPDSYAMGRLLSTRRSPLGRSLLLASRYVFAR